MNREDASHSGGQKRAEHLDAVLRAVRAVNRLIVRDKDAESLIREVCDTLVQTRGYYSAWVVLQHADGAIRAVAESGATSGQLLAQIETSGLPRCARVGLSQHCVYVVANPRVECPGCPHAAGYDDRAALVARLDYDDTVYGVLCVSTPREFVRDHEEVDLVAEMASDIGFALHSIAQSDALHVAMERLLDDGERFARAGGAEGGPGIAQYESHLRTLTEVSLDWVWQVDSDGIYRFVSDNVRRMMGYEPEEVIGKRPFDFMTPEEAERVGAIFAEIVAKKSRIVGLEDTLLKKDGTPVVFETNALPLLDSRGRLTGYFGTCRDVTGQRRAEDTLQQSEEKYRTLFEQSTEAISLVSPEGRVLDANRTWLDLFGYSREELPSLRMSELYANPADRADFVTRIGRDGYLRDECWYRKKSGELFLCQRSVVAQRNVHDASTVFYSVSRDVTSERRRMEQLQLRGQLLDWTYDAILLMDLDGVLLYVNDAAARATGHTVREMLGLNIRDVTAPDRAAQAKPRIEQIAREGGVAFETTHVTKEGERRDVEVRARLVESGGRKLVLSAERDVTSRKHAERALRDSEERFRGVFEHSPVGMAIVDTSSQRFVQVNDAYLELVGYSREELLQLTVADVTHPDDWALEQVAIQRRLEAGTRGYTLDKRYVRKDGEIRTVILVGEMLDLQEGSPPLAMATAVDITERKLAEDLLENRNIELEQIFEAMPEALVYADTQRRIVRVNPAFTHMFGYRPHEVYGKQTKVIYAHEEEFYRQGDIRYNTGAPDMYEPYCIDYRRKNGEVFPGETVGTPVRDAQGNVVGLLGLVNDISQRRRAEEALRTSEETARALIDATADSAALLAPDGTILSANRAMAAALGFDSPLEIAGRDGFALLPPDLAVRRRERFEEALEGGAAVRFEDERDGRVLFNTMYPVAGEDGKVHSVALFARDMTEQRGLEEELIASREELRLLAQRVQQAREEERTAIARELHDQVGQSLTALKLDLARLQKSLRQEGRATPELIGAMLSLVDQSADDVRRISSELRPGVLDDFGLQGAIEWQVEQLQERTSLRFMLDLQREEVPLDTGRRTALFRAFQELLTNVVRHSSADTVRVSLVVEGGDLLLNVTDNGRGIESKHVDSHSSLGLVGIRERVAPYGGTLTIKRARGKGTTAIVSIPLTMSEL